MNEHGEPRRPKLRRVRKSRTTTRRASRRSPRACWRERARLLGAAAAVLAVSTITLAGTPAAANEPGRSGPTNLLLVTLDTTRADRLGCYGYRAAHTPAIDAVAARGVLFEQAYTSCPLTLPAHTTLFTGLEPPEHGIRINGKNSVPADILTLAEALGTASYQTAAFVSAFVLDAKFGLSQGFDTYDDDLTGAYPQQVSAPLSRYRAGNLVTDAALGWLGQAVANPESRRPFFCWVHLYDPHFPHFPHPELAGTRFEGQSSYDGEIAFVDSQVKRLMAFLEERNLTEKTLVVIAGDHGEGLDDHGEMEHGYLLNQEVLHVPLIVSQPGRIPEATRVSSLVTLTDFFPTILDLLGVPDIPRTGGRSFAAALRGGDLTPRAAYAETDLPFTSYGWSPLRGLTTAAWRYVRTSKPELYDRKADPTERRNLASTRADEVRDLDAELARLEAGFKSRSAPDVVLGAEERRQLEALGYVAGEDGREGSPDGRQLRDVKDMLHLKHLDARLRAGIQTKKLPQAQAVRMARVLVKQSPDTAVFRHRLATVLMSQGDLDEAIEQLTAAVRLQPSFADAHNSLGTAYLRQNKVNDATTHFSAALRIAPDLAEAHLGMGNALAGRGNIREARQHYRMAIKLQPDYADAYLNLANILVRSGNTQQAIRLFRKAIDLKPDSAVAHNNLALVLAEQGQVARAITHHRAAVGLAPAFATAHFNLGTLLAKTGQRAEATKHLAEAVRLTPDDPQNAASLAWILATAPEAAVRDGARAVELAEHGCKLTGFRDARIFGTLAAAYAEAGRFEDATLAAQGTIQLAQASHQDEIATQARRMLAAFSAGRPFRERGGRDALSGRARAGIASRPGVPAANRAPHAAPPPPPAEPSSPRE